MKTNKTHTPDPAAKGFVKRAFFFDGFDGSEYILLPACTYDGNRFDALHKKYPPMFERNEVAVDMPLTICDIPRLCKDESGKIEVTTGELATPCIGIFDSKRRKAHFIFTAQGFEGKNFGLTYEVGKFTVSWPSARNRCYRGGPAYAGADEGAYIAETDKIEIPYQYLEFDCADIPCFLRLYLENRKVTGQKCSRPGGFDYNKVWRALEDAYNKFHYSDQYGLYTMAEKRENSTSGNSGAFGFWQAGWIGGGIASYPLLKLGTPKTAKRALACFDFLVSTQTPCGLFRSIMSGDGTFYGDGFELFGYKGLEDYHLLRKSADVLFFMYKHFAVMAEKRIAIKPKYIDSAKKLADYFVRLWDKYGQFGQLVSIETGDIIAGNSSSAVIAIAGLCESYQYFGDSNYLRVAEAAGEYYYHHALAKGYTTGGPGEILQSPDSESAIALLESYVCLYETAKDQKWLDYAETAAALCSTWVVSYNYEFPRQSMFHRLGIKTTGTVFANAANKHSAPGFCTLSGDSLYRLYQYTGNKLYLELIQDVASAIAQCMSTAEKPFYTSFGPPRIMPPGFINERVNMSDWEGADGIGEVFYGACWPEVSLMLTIAELRNILE
ncbi:MAG: hypothetical protein FWE62_01615 [Firmicutes bacterium]|nr:hypothetical protein [Bacillota bacterium]